MASAKAKSRAENAGIKRRSRKTPHKQPKSSGRTVAASKADGLEAASSAPMVLPETLDSASAGDIKEQFLLRRGSPILVDARQVRRIGMQVVQVLIAAARTWQAEGQSYAVTNPSGEFLDTLALAGLRNEQLLVEGFAK